MRSASAQPLWLGDVRSPGPLWCCLAAPCRCLFALGYRGSGVGGVGGVCGAGGAGATGSVGGVGGVVPPGPRFRVRLRLFELATGAARPGRFGARFLRLCAGSRLRVRVRRGGGGSSGGLSGMCTVSPLPAGWSDRRQVSRRFGCSCCGSGLGSLARVTPCSASAPQHHRSLPWAPSTLYMLTAMDSKAQYPPPVDGHTRMPCELAHVRSWSPTLAWFAAGPGPMACSVSAFSHSRGARPQ